MKKLGLLLVLVLVLGLLCGCSENSKIYGTWVNVSVDPEADVRSFLEAMDFYQEEIALVDMTSMKTATLFRFNEDNTYERGVDEEATAALTKEFVEGMMAALYAGRDTLVGLYGEEVKTLTREEFNQMYAEMFGCGDYAEMLDMFAYETWTFELEKGTFNAAMGNIYLTPEGTDEAQSATYTLKGDNLIIGYADGDVEYTKE